MISHVQLIAEQFSGGRFRAEIEEKIKLAIHDPCYLARYNGMVEEPRFILDHIKGVETAEPKECASSTTCCGAGGGQFWTDSHNAERPNVIRLKAIVAETNTKNICTSCPFCMSMMESARSMDDSLKDVVVEDIAEIVAKNLK